MSVVGDTIVHDSGPELMCESSEESDDRTKSIAPKGGCSHVIATVNEVRDVVSVKGEDKFKVVKGVK